jgi:hypothetical protein
MAYIRVIYKARRYKFDFVSSNQLDQLIARDEITHFYRPSEKRWVNVKLDPVRRRGGWYQGSERRRANDRVKSKERKGSPKGYWIEGLWQDIENP